GPAARARTAGGAGDLHRGVRPPAPADHGDAYIAALIDASSIVILPSCSVTLPVASTFLPANSTSFSFLLSVHAPVTWKMPASVTTARGAPFFAHVVAQSA